MKLKYLVFGCSALLLSACVSEPDGGSSSGAVSSQQQSSMAPISSQQTTSSSPVALDGAAIYDAQCKLCHGGKGNDGFASLKNDELSFEQMVVSTRDTMPEGKPQYCDEDCARAVTDYIKNDLLAGDVPQSSAAQSSIASTVDPSLLSGKELYEADLGAGSCASCHGDNGEGIDSRGGSLIEEECESCQVSPSNLIAEIESTMPLRAAHLCVGECAAKVSQYIYETFAGKQWVITACTDEINKTSPMRRLNKSDIANAVQDVFGTGAAQIKAALPNEQEVIGGFATVGSALTTSTDWTTALVNGAVEAADAIVDAGGFPKCAGDAPSIIDPEPKLGECTTTPQCAQMYAGATDCSNGQGGVCLCGTELCSASGGGAPSAGQCFDEALATTGKLLFRRALTNAEVTRFKAIRDNVSVKTGAQTNGHKAVLVALISSPKFVFSLSSDEKASARNLTGAELADRLALTLWGSVPDETLIDVASSNQLKGAELEKQIDRMINDARFDRFSEVFGDAWLGLDGYLLKGSDVNKTDEQWNTLLADMKTETRTFLRHIIKNNLPVNEIYTAEYSFLNARLKEHYGFAVSGNNNDFVKTNYPNNSSRRGLMTQAAILAKAFDGGKTSVVKRGVLPLEAFTCTAPRPPTDNEALEEAINDQANSNATEKEKIADRASKNTCASCHAVIDPLGWVFTEFGVAGEDVNLDPDGDALNTSGSLYNQNFANAHGMVDIVVEEDKFASCFSNKFLIHSLGRKVSYGSSFEDQCAIDEAIKLATVNDSVGTRDLIKSLMRSNISTFSGTVENQ